MENYWREGLHTLSLNEVCRRAKISKPALYREFGNEDGLMEAALEHYRQLAVAPLLTFLASEQPFAEVLDQVIVGMTSVGETPAGCLFTEMRLAAPRVGPLTEARLRLVESERCEVFEAWYRRALGAGEVDAAIHPELAAGYIDTQFTTVLVQMAAGRSADSVRAEARLAFRVLQVER